MSQYPPLLQDLIALLTHLPSIGPKSAERLAVHLLHKPAEEIMKWSSLLEKISKNIKKCRWCNNFSETDPCHICQDNKRDKNILCVVAAHPDLEAIEKTGRYQGQYYVLRGLIEPIHGRGPQEAAIPELLKRIKNSAAPIEEIILALNPDMSGETTLLYLKKELNKLPAKITRLARGLPVGADLEYADEVTLSEALINRHQVK